MNVERLHFWLTFLSNVAVLLGILFIVIEIQQNTDAIRNQSSLAVNDSLAHLNEAIYSDPGMADIWNRGRQSLDSLDAVERERFMAFLLERFNLAVYVRELERANAGDVHIDWIGIMEREILSNPGICEFVKTNPLDSGEIWSSTASACVFEGQ